MGRCAGECQIRGRVLSARNHLLGSHAAEENHPCGSYLEDLALWAALVGLPASHSPFARHYEGNFC